MGWLEDRQEKRENGAQVVALAIGNCPDVGRHYATEVNKGSIRMQSWQSKLNDQYRAGYRLAHVFEQDGNTVQVFEHIHP